MPVTAKVAGAKRFFIGVLELPSGLHERLGVVSPGSTNEQIAVRRPGAKLGQERVATHLIPTPDRELNRGSMEIASGSCTISSPHFETEAAKSRGDGVRAAAELIRA